MQVWHPGPGHPQWRGWLEASGRGGGGIGDGGHRVAGGRQLSDQEPSQWRQGSGPLRITARGLVLASAVQLDTGRGEVPFNPVP